MACGAPRAEPAPAREQRKTWHGHAYEALVNVDPDDSEARERMLEAFRLKGCQPGLQAYS
jgi:hypothetical protein